jgi:lysophospholipase L1-like esterase
MNTEMLRRLTEPGVTEANDPYCLGLGEAEKLLAGARWQRLLVMGDSIAAGNGDPVDGYLDRSWADRLAAALGLAGQTAYLNLGHVGAHAAEIRQWQLARALAFGADLALVVGGANDAFRRSFEASAVEADLAHIVGTLSEAGALVVTFGCFDMGRTSFLPPDRRRGLSERLHILGRLTETAGRRHGGVHVDFLRHPAFSDALLSADGLHINRRGHAVVATEVIRSLAHHLAEQVVRTSVTS